MLFPGFFVFPLHVVYHLDFMDSYIFLITIQRETTVIREVLVYTNILACLHKREDDDDMTWGLGVKPCCKPLPDSPSLGAVLFMAVSK